MPDVVLCIPTKNRHASLARTLARCPASPLICDQSVAPYPGSIHRPDLNGLPAARNVLLRLADAEIVVFLDDDTDLGADFLTALEACIRRWPEAVGWGPVLEVRPQRVRLLHRLVQLGCFRDERRLTGARCDAPTTALFGACFAVRRQEALAVGFDDHLRGYGLGEDLDFCRRLVARTGRPLRFCRNLRAIHRCDGANRADPVRRGEAKARFLRWWARRHGQGNPVTLFHLGIALVAAALGRGHEPGSWRGVLKGLF